MNHNQDAELTPDVDRSAADEEVAEEPESRATTGGAAAAGAVTGGVVGLAGGPIGAVIGAVGGAIIGAATERLMHADDHSEIAPAEEAAPEDPLAPLP